MSPVRQQQPYTKIAGIMLILSAALATIAFFLLEVRGIAELTAFTLFLGLLAWIVTQVRRW